MVAEYLSGVLGVKPHMARSMVDTAVLVAALFVLRCLVGRVIARNVDDAFRRYRLRRALDYVGGIIGAIFLVRIWFGGLENMGTFFGLLSAGVAVALSDVLANLAGWLFIIVRRPFVVGDRIEIDGKIGDVVDVRLFNTLLLECGNWVSADQSTGRTLVVPNGLIFKKPTANYTSGFNFIWEEIEVLVTFESDWKRAKQVLEQIVDEVAKPYARQARREIDEASKDRLIVYRHVDPIVYTSVQDSGVVLSIRYLAPVRKRRQLSSAIWERLLEAFQREPEIDLAYPTQRAYMNFVEGKPGLRPQK